MTVTLDSDWEFEPTPKRIKEDYTVTIRPIESKVDEAREYVEAIKEVILHLNSKSKLPVGLLRLIRDSSVQGISWDATAASCDKSCKNIIGCKRCVNLWYSGSEALMKTGPSCHAEGGYCETVVLRGFDEFLVEAKMAIEADNASDRNSNDLPNALP